MAALDPRFGPVPGRGYWPLENIQAKPQPEPPDEQKRPPLGEATLELNETLYDDE
jgi:hypothetical protein